MPKKRKVSIEKLLEAFRLYDSGASFESVVDTLHLDMNSITLNLYYQGYQQHGLEALLPKQSNRRYSECFKREIVRMHESEGYSPRASAAEYNIPAHETVRGWIMRYTAGKPLADYTPRPEVYTMKTRKTTYEERVEIVNACLENGLNYKETTARYNVKYAQVYGWVQKYKTHGNAGLVDGRGRGKPTAALSESDAQAARIEALEARNKWLEMENEVLKKQKQIEEKLMRQDSDKKWRTRR
ncbi:helix-turn-helix domain-containing protein [Salinicoccus luteus]|uniref:helix-turn-helix domain-containing protein n=1 Tax=Salinicoccus luteus TaxID=367840 RepID=UPI0004E240C3